MLDLLVAQGHRLLDHLGEHEVIRGLMLAGLLARSARPGDAEGFYRDALQRPCKVVPGVQRIHERMAVGEKIGLGEYFGDEES